MREMTVCTSCFLGRKKRTSTYMVQRRDERASEGSKRTEDPSMQGALRCPLGCDPISFPSPHLSKTPLPSARPRYLGSPHRSLPSSSSRATSPPASPVAQECHCGMARHDPSGRTPTSTRWGQPCWLWSSRSSRSSRWR